jgi:hypothetical protein
MEQETYKEAQDRMIKQYDKEKEAVFAIKDTDAFKVIIKWWESELERVDAMIDNAKDKDEIYSLVLEKKPIKKFYRFLINMTTQ